MKIVTIMKNNVTRYAIADDTGKIVDDAQGYGYSTKQKANKALWWKFNNGQHICDINVNWWKKHKQLWLDINDFLMTWQKEICLGEFTDEEINEWCKTHASELNIDLPNKMLKFMFSKHGSKMLNKALSQSK